MTNPDPLRNLPTNLRLIAAGRYRPPYGSGRAPADLEGDVLREAAQQLEALSVSLKQKTALVEELQKEMKQIYADSATLTVLKQIRGTNPR